MKTKNVTVCYSNGRDSVSIVKGIIDYDNYLHLGMCLSDPRYDFIEVYVDTIRTYVNKSKIIKITEI